MGAGAMIALVGSILGALVGLLLALGQVKLVRAYSVGKPDEIKQRAYDTIDQLKLSSFFLMPLIFGIIGYIAAVSWFG
jgi:uncharacterized membrane protein